MLHNLAIDLVANGELVLAWEGGDFHDRVYWTIIIEDPTSGEPLTICHHTDGGLHNALREAWALLTNSDDFKVMAATSTTETITSFWGRAYGVNFSRGIDVCSTKALQVPGMAYRLWGRHGIDD